MLQCVHTWRPFIFVIRALHDKFRTYRTVPFKILLHIQIGANNDEIKLILEKYFRIGLTGPNFMQEEIKRELL